jgi:hypothetical protein
LIKAIFASSPAVVGLDILVAVVVSSNPTHGEVYSIQDCDHSSVTNFCQVLAVSSTL